MNVMVKQLMSALDQVLKSKGFRHAGLIWNRDRHGLTQVVDLQLSKHGSNRKRDFTLNFGVFSARLYSLCWAKPAPRIVKETDCVVRARAGAVLTGGFNKRARDVWWNLNDPTDIERLCGEIVDVITTKGLVFLDEFQSLDDMRAFLSRLDAWPADFWLNRLYLAMLTAETGNTAEAREMFERIRNEDPDVWSMRARRIAAAYGAD